MDAKKRRRSYWVAALVLVGTSLGLAAQRDWTSVVIFGAALIGAIGVLWRWWTVDRKLPRDVEAPSRS
jgi:dolichyl-phosphate-mannose--protein O-mannosyl transferase